MSIVAVINGDEVVAIIDSNSAAYAAELAQDNPGLAGVYLSAVEGDVIGKIYDPATDAVFDPVPVGPGE